MDKQFVFITDKEYKELKAKEEKYDLLMERMQACRLYYMNHLEHGWLCDNCVHQQKIMDGRVMF